MRAKISDKRLKWRLWITPSATIAFSFSKSSVSGVVHAARHA